MTEAAFHPPTSDPPSPQPELQPAPQPASFTVPADEALDEEWRIGDWSFRPRLHRLSRDGEPVRLEPKVSDLLLFLARRARQP